MGLFMHPLLHAGLWPEGGGGGAGRKMWRWRSCEHMGPYPTRTLLRRHEVCVPLREWFIFQKATAYRFAFSIELIFAV